MPQIPMIANGKDIYWPFLLFQVKNVARFAQKQCQCVGHRCEKLRVKKVGEGKYNIAGRNVFVRVSFPCSQLGNLTAIGVFLEIMYLCFWPGKRFLH